MKRLLFFLLSATLLQAEEAPRVVTAGGAITEMVYALGAGNSLAGADTSSTYPESAAKLPQIGYSRALSAEGILSLNPNLLIATTEAGPPATIDQVRTAGVKVLLLSAAHTPEAVETRLTEIAGALGRQDKLPAVLAQLREELQAAQEQVKSSPAHPKVLFIYARGGGVMNVSGHSTAADAMIKLAGGENAVSAYEGYKPLTSEAAVSAAPDVILLTSRGLESSGGIDGVLQSPGLAQTPAGKARRVIAMDDLYLLGFGPRLGQAVRELAEKLQPDVRVSAQ